MRLDTKHLSMVEFILEGLQIDGAHHKQWFLCEILRSLVGHKAYEAYCDELDFDEGIIP